MSKKKILVTKKISDKFPELEILFDYTQYSAIQTITSNTINQTLKDQITENALKKSYVIFTSLKAANIIIEKIDLKLFKGVFCVGDRIAKKLKKYHITITHKTNYAEQLAELIAKEYTKESFVFFCGNLRLDTLPNTFIKDNINYTEVIVYETLISEHKFKEKFDAIIFFSPSAVTSFCKKNTIEEKTDYFCIGKTTKKALESKSSYKLNIYTPPTPSIIQTIETIKKFYYKE